MSWAKVTLNEICETQYGYTASATDEPIGPKFLRITDIVNSTIDWSSVPYCPINENDLEKYLLKKGDIVIARTGATTGYAKLIREHENKAVFASYLVRLKLNQEVAYPGFVGRLLESNVYKVFVESIKGGAAQPNANAKTLTLFKLALPDLDTQKCISEVLSAYDDLIENNKRRIELLEESARKVYKEWFVRFRFPGHEHVKIVDGIPEGWALENVKNVCSKFVDGDWIESKDQGGEDFRILQISNIGVDNFVETGNYRYISERTFDRLNCDEVLPGDLLISRMPKKIGRAWMVTDMPWRMVTAVDVTIARGDPSKVNRFYLLYHLNSAQHIARCESGATGTTRLRVSRRVMGGLPILIPPVAMQIEFSEFAESIHCQKQNLQKQIESLQKARDLLLPKLMSGEIAV